MILFEDLLKAIMWNHKIVQKQILDITFLIPIM